MTEKAETKGIPPCPALLREEAFYRQLQERVLKVRLYGCYGKIRHQQPKPDEERKFNFTLAGLTQGSFQKGVSPLFRLGGGAHIQCGMQAKGI